MVNQTFNSRIGRNDSSITSVAMAEAWIIRLQVSHMHTFLCLIKRPKKSCIQLTGLFHHFPNLHKMDFIVPRPDPEFLPPYPEDYATETPKRNQTHIRHNWWHISILFNPSIDEFRETVTPYILVDRNAHEH